MGVWVWEKSVGSSQESNFLIEMNMRETRKKTNEKTDANETDKTILVCVWMERDVL